MASITSPEFPIASPELRPAVEQTAGRPARLLDTETKATYVVMAAEYFEQLVPDGAGEEPPNGRVPGELVDEFPAPGTPEWGRMNQRRAELIRKNLRGQLTDAERQQYEWLQRRSLEALDAPGCGDRILILSDHRTGSESCAPVATVGWNDAQDLPPSIHGRRGIDRAELVPRTSRAAGGSSAGGRVVILVQECRPPAFGRRMFSGRERLLTRPPPERVDHDRRGSLLAKALA